MCSLCAHQGARKSIRFGLPSLLLYCSERMAPKPKAPSKRQETNIKIRVTDAQKRAIEAAAAKDGQDVSSFARHLMLERARALGIEV